jgi:hypothetical protein
VRGCGSAGRPDHAFAAGLYNHERTVDVQHVWWMSKPLEGAAVRGTEYVSVPSTKGITRVLLFLDDAARVKTPYQVERSAPWDFRRTSANGAVPWQTTGVSDGTHVISADVTTTTGVSHLDAAFTVSNGAPSSGADYTYADIASVPTGTTEAESLTIGDKVYLFGATDWPSGRCGC